jgi:iron complex outermembrane receptor protein
VSYAAGKAGALFATFAEKSRFPTLKDRYSYKLGKAIPDPELRPEHAQNWTVGYSRVFGRATMAQVDFFRSSVRNEIENISFLSPLCTGGGKGAGCQEAVNVGRELHEGINVTVRSTPFSRLTLDAHFSYLNRNITGTPGIFPFGTPKQKTVGSAMVRMPRGAMGILSMRYESGMTGMSDNGLPLPVSKFATVDIGGTLPIEQRFALQAGVKNLLDRNYYLWEGFPEEGRNWYLSARYRF